MASVNKVILIGNLGRDPEVRYLPDGSAVANLSIATTSGWKDKTSGERREETEWHRIVLYGRLAEIAGEYCKKGRSVYLEGRLKTRKWTDKDGQEKYTTEIVCDQLQMLGSRDSNNTGGSGADDFGGDFTPSSGTSSPRTQTLRSGQDTNNAHTPPSSGGLSANRPSPGLADMDDDIPF